MRMATREIITIPDPILRSVSEPLAEVDDDVRQLAHDMLETMYAAPGIGLAAPQVAVPRRLIVMDLARDEEPKAPIVMVNPQIVERGGEPRPHEEGCLSIPEYFAEIERPGQCTVRYVDLEGMPQERVCEGLLSTVVQHEVDHLDGVLFIDYLSRLRRDMVIRKFTKAKRSTQEMA